MATPTIPNGKDYMNSVTYTGTGSDNAVTGVGFAPDATWLKRRDSGNADWGAYDTSRGVTKAIKLNKEDAESTESNGLKVFGTDGFTVGSSGDVNASGGTFVSFNWLLNGGTTSANTDGSISSTVQSNTDSGFSIVQYTGTGSNATVGHGLSVAPTWVMTKVLDAQVSGFTVGLSADPSGFNNFMYLNESTNSRASSTTWQDTAPTSSVFSVGSSSTSNKSGSSMVAYCWHEVDGFSKFSAYEGNGSSNGAFIYLGLTAQWVMIKEIDSSNDWCIWDSARFPLNPTNNSLFTSLAQGDNGSSLDIDVLSNGVKIRTSNTQLNRSGSTYVLLAFAKNPFTGDGVSPVTAR